MRQEEMKEGRITAKHIYRMTICQPVCTFLFSEVHTVNFPSPTDEETCQESSERA